MVEQETGLFWLAARTLRAARRRNDHVVVEESLADIGVIGEMTESATLRRQCEDILNPPPPPSTRAIKQ